MTPPFLLRATFLLTAGAGVALAVLGLLTLSLPRMVAGTALWMVSVVAWEILTGRFA